MTRILRSDWKEDYFNMGYLIFFGIGVLLTLVLVQKPVLITVHHKYENLKPELTKDDLAVLEEGMLKENPKEDNLYEKLDQTIADVNDIMGGSDR